MAELPSAAEELLCANGIARAVHEQEHAMLRLRRELGRLRGGKKAVAG